MSTVVPLRELASIHTGGTPSKSQSSYWIGDIPWVSPKDVFGDSIADTEDHISQAAVDGSATRIVPKDSILVVVRSGILVRRVPVAIATKPVAFNQDIKAAVVDQSRCLPEYLFWYLRSRERLILTQGVKKGATVHSLSAGFLENLRVPLPPIREQRYIVDVLSRAASIRRLRDQAQAKAREIVPALFVDMFGDPATNPKGWDISALGSEIEGFEGGKNVAAGDSEGNSRGLRILKVSAVTSGEFDPTESKPAPPDFDPPSSYYVRKGDILVSRANTVELVGAAALVTTEPHGLLLPDKIWRIVWKKNSRLYPPFLLSYLQNRHVRSLMSRMATGTSGSMKNISQAKLVTLPIYIPPLPMQEEFAARVGELGAVSSLSERASVMADELSRSLQHKAFG